METYWVFHLAVSWQGPPNPNPSPALNPPVSADPAFAPAATSHADTTSTALRVSQPTKDKVRQTTIRAAAVQMVFASRSSQEFITPEHVSKLEAWCGQAVLDALLAMDIPQDVRIAKFSGSIAQITNIFDLRSNCIPRKGVFGTWSVLPWIRSQHLTRVPQTTMKLKFPQSVKQLNN